MTAEENLKLLTSGVNQMQVFHLEWRKGQTWFNVAYYFFPNETHKIIGTKDDCFYDDGKIEAFKKKLVEMWSK